MIHKSIEKYEAVHHSVWWAPLRHAFKATKLSWVYLAIIGNLQHEQEIIGKTLRHRKKGRVVATWLVDNFYHTPG